MYHPLDVALLAFESQKVVELRLVKLAWGGREGHAEARRMMVEKIDASIEAAQTLMTGGSMDTVIRRYREHVAENTERLRDGR